MKKILINSCACYGSNDLHECYCNLNMKTQTAVEFLIKAFQGAYGDKVINVVSVQVQEAKAMEKEQLEDAWIKGMKSNNNNFEGI